MTRDVNTAELLQELSALRTRLADLEASGNEHRRAEEALRESEERYYKVFNHSNDAIFVFDPSKDQILDVNPKACNMLGYSQEELRALPISAIHPREMPQLQAFAQSVFNLGQGWTDELSCLTKSGQLLPAEISASLADMGGMRCMIAMVRDVTERNRAEEARRQLAVLEERNRLAREIHDSLARGLTGIVWQLNGARQAVEGGGKRALEAMGRVRDLARECLRDARRSVWDLRAGLLQGLSLAEALRQEGEKVAADGSLHLSFTVSGKERVLPSGVEAAVLRICQESLANVLKHARATTVAVTLAFEDSAVRLTVQDNGVGFDTEDTQSGREGAGRFGLTGMRERARLLGGELTLKSEPGQGTLVEAQLPPQ